MQAPIVIDRDKNAAGMGVIYVLASLTNAHDCRHMANFIPPTVGDDPECIDAVGIEPGNARMANDALLNHPVSAVVFDQTFHVKAGNRVDPI